MDRWSRWSLLKEDPWPGGVLRLCVLGVTRWVHTNRSSSLLCRWPGDDNVGMVRTQRDSVHIPATMASLALVTDGVFICGTWSRPIAPDHHFVLINPGARGRLNSVLQQSVSVHAQVAFSFIPTEHASALGKATAHSPVKTCTLHLYMWRSLKMESIHLSLPVLKVTSDKSLQTLFSPFF